MRINILNAILTAFLLSACGTVYHYAEFIKPSDQYIPSNIYAVGIINRGASYPNAMTIYSNGIPYEYIKGYPEAIAEKTIESFEKQVEEINRYDVVPLEWDLSERDYRKFVLEPLSAGEIDSICEVFSLDGLIVLEGVELAIRTKGNINVVTLVDDAGTPARVPEFSQDQEVSYTVLWRFYDGYNLKLIDEFQETYQRFFSQVAYSAEEAQSTDPTTMRLVDVAFAAADDYVERVAPHWETGFREYYRTSDENLIRISNDLESSRNWKEAAERWKQYTESNNPNLRYAATYNMAVASEMMGRPRVAKEWLERALAIKESKKGTNYMETINKQILIYDVVDRQLGIETE